MPDLAVVICPHGGAAGGVSGIARHQAINVPDMSLKPWAAMCWRPHHAMMVEEIETERMRAAGVNVEVIKGYDICLKGEGGPTCMTRPCQGLRWPRTF
jgi:hypothetical protein